MSSAPDFVARRARVVLLVLTVGVIALFAITGGSDGSDGIDEVNTAGATVITTVSSSVAPTSSTPAVESTAAPATVSAPAPTTTAAAVPTTAAAADALAFRKPLNGTVNVTLKWDCYDCVDWPTLRNKHHPAVDYLASDSNIVAAADGVVVKMNTGCGGQGCGNSFGNWLFLRHTLTDGSTLYSFYAHMAEMTPAVTEGACIKSGQKIGVIGNTGIASAAHLHFAIQTNTNLLDYTSASSATVGSVDPDTLYGKVKVKSC
jgi:murein DD-endopeptidase MepM/ murein hydrolase activator NlpD